MLPSIASAAPKRPLAAVPVQPSQPVAARAASTASRIPTIAISPPSPPPPPPAAYMQSSEPMPSPVVSSMHHADMENMQLDMLDIPSAVRESMGYDEDEEDFSEAGDDDDVDQKADIMYAKEKEFAKFVPEKKLVSAEDEIRKVKDIMGDNIEKVLQRSENLELLESKSVELEESSQKFYKQASVQKKGSSLLHVCCKPCVDCVQVCLNCFGACVSVMESPIQSCKGCGHRVADGISAIVASVKQLFTKSILFDNVLADTENAFQTLAKFLVILIDYSVAPNTLYYYVIGIWIEIIRWMISYVVILSSTVVLILPSFFTLLIVRTSTIEKESKAFGGK